MLVRLVGDAERQQRPVPTPSTLQPTAVEAVHAGLDMELPWRYNYSTLTDLVTAGSLTSADLATSTARILEQKYRFKVDKLTRRSASRRRSPSTTRTPSIANNNQTNPAIGMSHIALAQKAAEESMVLLKNSNNTLPIKSTQKKIAVLGAKVNYTRAVDEQPGHVQHGSGGVLNCTLDFTTNVRTGDLGSSRVFSDPARRRAVRRASWPPPPAHGATVTTVTHSASARRRRADFIVVIAGLTPAGRGRGVHGRRRSHERQHRRSHDRQPGLDPKQNSGVQNGLITARRGAGQAVGRRARRRQRHRHAVATRTRPRWSWPGTPGMVGGTRARPAAVRRRRHPAASCRSPGTRTSRTGRRSPRTPARRRWTTSSATATSTRTAPQLTPASGSVPVRLRPLVHDVQLQQPAGAVQRR